MVKLSSCRVCQQTQLNVI